MQRGRPKAELVVTAEERESLLRWARRPKTAQALSLRSQIVLACAEGQTNLGFIAGCYDPHRRRRGMDYRSPVNFELRADGSPSAIATDPHGSGVTPLSGGAAV